MTIIVITGTPGTGKTTLGKKLAKKLGFAFFNEKDLALKQGFGEWDHEENELVLDLKQLGNVLDEISAEEKNIVFEGHLLCETKFNADIIFILRVDPELLEFRLEERHYSPEKLMDNVFCEGIDYCLKHAKRKFNAEKVVEIKNEKEIKDALDNILLELRERGLINE